MVDRVCTGRRIGPQGVEIDALNTVLISGGVDGTLKFWGFNSHDLIENIDIGSGVAQLEISREIR